MKINEIQEKQLPELDDEFVKDISEFDTLEELKKDVEKNIKELKEKEANKEFENEIIETIVKNSTIDLPKEMIDTEVEHMFNEFSQGLAYQGMNIDMYAKYINNSVDDLKNEMRSEAEKRVKGSLVLEKIKEIENISYTDEQLDEELSNMALAYNMDVEKIKEILPAEQRGYMAENIAIRNTVEFLNKQTKRI